MSTCYQVWGSFERGLAGRFVQDSAKRNRERHWKNVEKNKLEQHKKIEYMKQMQYNAVKMQQKVKHMACGSGVEQRCDDLSCQHIVGMLKK